MAWLAGFCLAEEEQQQHESEQEEEGRRIVDYTLQ